MDFDHVVGGLQSVGPAYGFIFVAPNDDALSLVHRTILKGKVARLLLNNPLPEGSRLTYGAGTSAICNIVDGRGHAVPMFGPMTLRATHRNLLPFVTQWKVAEIVPDGPSLKESKAPDFEKLTVQARTYSGDGFINEHDRWTNQHGLGFFQTQISLPESMTLRLFMGYDGPFRLWLDNKPFYTDLEGVNPCLPDKAAKTIALRKGVHKLSIGMDLAYGKSWGFFLRFARMDLTPAQKRAGEYARPVYMAVE